ncbi:hypothetical protein H6G80_03870 [Nostoc sp. FACHB-87]|uniref:hypothetical protein n=1 Tax=Nostocaceae TaxID=1162 RepID=UPI001684CFE1|nr:MULTISPECIES: hypothetical protein [Nostocaceae]MBD2453212.1 hypothetical protein [Nostoc sp. FACHB-87]MBD2475009.1 hypothetical protein [Anabaena sp. FACHB-83]
MNFNALMISSAARYTVAKKILGDRITVESAAQINSWLLDKESQLPAYTDAEYIDQAIALYLKSHQSAA